MKLDKQNEGQALIVVVGLAAVLTVLIVAALQFSSTQVIIAGKQSNLESALYVAQAGAERAVSYVANGGSAPWSSAGQVGNGTYVVAVLPALQPSMAPQTVTGWINLNPSGGSGYTFVLTKPDGSTITQAALIPTYTGYTGSAASVQIQPNCSGIQNNLTVNDVNYQMQNQYGMNIFADAMSVCIYNSQINTNGLAVGSWNIAIATSCASIIVSQ